ncbi:unnamed protein product [Bursaphelenchus xylophilus]|uniref:triacylglycerol lipase n=1 Tax=Bursaphelenchus xylophilus TaxID=6326 RepID=A0A1I7RZB8_BURXY|nr:unnamed protein product [Bursaphelenchus xylophilus]CAG9106635.1 unnamed protein product [Bursaphelenchus xylophilus]
MTIQDNGVQLPRKPSVRFELDANDSSESVPQTKNVTPLNSPNLRQQSPPCCGQETSTCSSPTKFTDPSKLNLSFAGCGFLCVYHAGVCAAIKEYAPQLTRNKIYGASAGAIVGAGVICNVCVSAAISIMLQAASEAQRGTLKTLNPNFDLSGIVRKGLESHLPLDAHIQCSGRLFISLTRASDYRNVMVSEFETREELIQAIVCSSFIPIICGVRPPKFKGVEYVDGGLSNNQPMMGDENTLTVSPFSGEHDICPWDRDSASLLGIDFTNTHIRMTTGNLFRMITCFFPPSLDICSKICRQGFQDALVLLTKKGLAPCVRCLTIQSNVLPVPEYKTPVNLPRVRRTSSMVSNPSRLRLTSECDMCNESEFNPEDATALFPSVLQTAFGEATKAESRLFIYLNSFRLYRYSRRLMAPAFLPVELAMYTAKTVQSWLYPKAAVDYFTQRLQATIELVQGFLDAAQSSSLEKPVPSYRVGLAEVERRQSAMSRRSSKQPGSTFATFDQTEADLCDEGSASELVKYSQEHDAILAYYYMDEKNQVQVCQIYDVNNPDVERPCHGHASKNRRSSAIPRMQSNQKNSHVKKSPPFMEEEEDLKYLGEPMEVDEPQPTMEMEALQIPANPTMSPVNGEDSGLSLTEDSNQEFSIKKRDACCSPIRRHQGQPNVHDNNNVDNEAASTRSAFHSHRPSRASLFDGRSSQLISQQSGQSASLTSLLRRHTMGPGQNPKFRLSNPTANRNSMGSTKSINSGPAAYHYWPPISSDSDQDGNDTFFVPLRARSASSNAYDGEPEQSDTDH